MRLTTLIATLLAAFVPGTILSAHAAPFVYVGGSSDSVAVVDGANNSVVTTIQVGTFPQGIAVTAAGTRVYVATDTLRVTDAATNTVVRKIPVGPGPIAVAVNPAGTRVYVADNGNNTVSVVDVLANQVIKAIPVGVYPYALAVNPAGTQVYVPNSFSGTVSVIDATTNEVIDTIAVAGLHAGSVAFHPDGTRAYFPATRTAVLTRSLTAGLSRLSTQIPTP